MLHIYVMFGAMLTLASKAPTLHIYLPAVW